MGNGLRIGKLVVLIVHIVERDIYGKITTVLQIGNIVQIAEQRLIAGEKGHDMSRYIDFEIAREYLHKACESLGGNGGLMLKIKFDEEPKADVQEVVHGAWQEKEIIDADHVDWQSARCSVCGKYHTTPYLYYFDNFNYCPSCGARMDVQDNTEI